MTKPHSLFCGAGRAIITPPVGTILCGYSPARASESLGDDLTATVIKLQSGETSALLITCTLCAFSAPIARKIQEATGAAAGVSPENVTVSATHTHSGPNTNRDFTWSRVNYEYIDTILLPGLVNAARQAAETCRPAQIGIGETESDVGINRRELKEDGSVVLGQNPWGPHDPRMTVVSFRDETGTIIANLIHYCCHCTASGVNTEITRDWAGVMMDMLEMETGAISGFYAGFEGDQGPNLPNGRTKGTYSMALQLGARAGIDAIRAFHSIKDWRDEPVRVLHSEIVVPFLPFPTREEAERNLQELGDLEQLRAEHKRDKVNQYLRWNKVIEELDSGRPAQTHWHYPQTIMTIGPVAIVPAPFEAFIELALRIRKGSPYRYTLNLCNTNDSLSYLPARTDIVRGGYEIWQFLCAFRTVYELPHDTDDHWVQQNLKILREE